MPLTDADQAVTSPPSVRLLAEAAQQTGVYSAPELECQCIDESPERSLTAWVVPPLVNRQDALDCEVLAEVFEMKQPPRSTRRAMRLCPPLDAHQRLLET